MKLVFGGRTTDIEELLAQCICAEYTAVQKSLGQSYCSFFGLVGFDSDNRAVQILDPFLDVSVKNAFRDEWCRLFEKHSELIQIDQIPFVAYYLEKDDFAAATKVRRDPKLALIPQESFRPCKQKVALKDLIPSKSIAKLLLETNLSREEKQFADACRCLVTAQKYGKAWRPACIPSQNREVALMNDLLSQSIEPKIGDRVKVFWPGDQQFYTGTVENIRTLSTFHHIVYDDSDQEWLPLSERLFELDDSTIRKKARRTVTIPGRLWPDERQSSRTKRSLAVTGNKNQNDERSLEKSSRSSYDHKIVNKKRVSDTNHAANPAKTESSLDESKSMVMPEQHGAIKSSNGIAPDEHINELMEELLFLIDRKPSAVPMPKVESLMDTLISVECDSIDDFRRRMRLGKTLRQIPALDERIDRLVKKTLNSIGLTLINQWKTALRARNSEDMVKAASNFVMLNEKRLSAAFIEKHGLTKLLEESKALFAEFGLDFPQFLNKYEYESGMKNVNTIN